MNKVRLRKELKRATTITRSVRFLGYIGLSYGAYLFAPWLGFVVGGVCVIAFAWDLEWLATKFIKWED